MNSRDEISQDIQGHVPHVADMVYFGEGEESRALQLVDCCCATISRHLRGDPFVTPYYAILRGQIVHEGERPHYGNAEQIITSVRKHLTRRGTKSP